MKRPGLNPHGTRPRLSSAPLRLAGRIVCRAIVCSLLVSSALAQTAPPFTKASQEYAAGQFKEAAADYEALVASGERSANLFYDLGNAYFRMGDLGRAILNYERALALDSHHPEADANLRIARDQARALELSVKEPERSLRLVTLNQYAVAGSIAFWAGIFSLAGLLFSQRRRSFAVWSMSILAVSIFLLSVAAIIWLDRGSKGRGLAVVTDQGVEARVATADNANSVLALPAGSEIKILSRRGDWIYAALPNSLRGWISAKGAEPVRF